MEVWEKEKLKCMEHDSARQVFPRYCEFSQISTSVSITYGNSGKSVFYFFYRVTRRKLKCGNKLLYQSVNSPYCSWWRMRWRIMAWTFPCFPHSYRNTAFSSQFQNVILYCNCMSTLPMQYIYLLHFIYFKFALHIFKWMSNMLEAKPKPYKPFFLEKVGVLPIRIV